MGQHLSTIDSQINDLIKTDRITLNSSTIISDCNQEDVNLFLPIKTLSDTTNCDAKISNFKRPWVKQIQNYLFLLTNVSKLEMINDVNENVYTSIISDYEQMIQGIRDVFEISEQTKISLISKLEEDKKSIKNPKNNQQKTRSPNTHSSFTTQLFTLFHLAERNASSLVHHFDKKTGNQAAAKQTGNILLNLSISNGMLKDILPFLNEHTFDTDNTYDVKNIFYELNKHFESVREEWQKQYLSEFGGHPDTSTASAQNHVSSSIMKYLSSMGVFPNKGQVPSHTKQFSGQFISVFIFAHMDFDNTIYSNTRFKSGSVNSSMSFEFHPDTFKQLFNIIKQLTMMNIENLNENLLHILIISLRLFTTHLKFLSAITINLQRDLLESNEYIKEIFPSSSFISNKQYELNEFISTDELETWFDILLILVCHNSEKIEHIQICREASKALIYVLDKKETLFIKKLSFICQCIVDNKYSIFIEQLLIEMNTTTLLLRWIEILCDKDDTKNETTIAFTILYSMIDSYFNSSNDMITQRIEQILQNFQKLVFVRLKSKFGPSTFSLAMKYITYILNNSNKKQTILNDILVSLSLMINTNKYFTFPTTQPILTTILPLLTEYILKNNSSYNYWLLGKMSQILLIGSPQDSLELYYNDKLQSPLFSGGCENRINENNQHPTNLYGSNLAVYSEFKSNDYQEQESSSDNELLMSIYNNTDQGAQLITKMRMHIKEKQHSLQKSIEQQSNDACAALFSVYIKYYRRINLVKFEMSRDNNQKPHEKLLSIFEYANRIQILFATTKGQGGNCNELYQHIKNKTLFLLSSIKESHLIPIIKCHSNDQIDQELIFKMKRQQSRRKIEKRTFRLIRHLFQACRQFKKSVLAKKKAIEQKEDNENILRRAIDQFVYGDFSNNKNTSQSDELIQCMSRQYERAITRLITYRFINKFIQNILNIEDKNVVEIILTIYLPYLRTSNSEWSYLENISATNFQIKEEIGNIYYSIIETVLLKLKYDEQMLSIRNVFNLLNLSYKSRDISYLYQYKFLETLFIPFVSFTEKSDWIISPHVKLIGYNWFRLYVIKLCENYDIEEFRDTTNSIFYKLILNELKELKQRLTMDIKDDTDHKNDSFNNAAIGWFINSSKDKNNLSTKFEIELCRNQWLMLLLRCIHSYEHIRILCATTDYIEELLDIYRYSEKQTTMLLALKILHKLILFVPEDIDEKLNNIIKNLLNEIVFSIGDRFNSQRMTSDIVNELIYMYRTLISFDSPWQIMAIQVISDVITSFNLSDTNKINNFLASLCILGGCIHPFCLGAIVQIFIGDEINNETELAVIVDVNTHALNLGTSDVLPYFVHYFETNKTEWISADKLRIEIDVPPPNLLSLPNPNDFLHSLFDVLGYFIQIDTSTTESLLLLQLKRQSIATLYRLLIDKALVEIFIEKPYASIIAKLSTSALVSKHHEQPANLRLFNKRHLEQYCLSLDRCLYFKQIIEEMTTTEKDQSLFILWNDVPFNQQRLTIDLPSMNKSEPCEWKQTASKREIQLFKQGRIGNDEIIIVPMPAQLSLSWILEDCGTMHQFPGRVYLMSDSSETLFASFTVDQLRLTEGKWYYCVRLLGSNFAQVGWATTGFNPTNTIGVGNDTYSWSFDGSQGVVIHNNQHYPFFYESVRWSTNDVCGCGIEIQGDDIRINYWLNGHSLGTAFANQFPIGTTTICNMLPNGHNTTYFPSVSLKVSDASMLSACEFIFNPEEMFECPLPKGYKPLLLPTLDYLDNSLVPYPFSAYLIDDKTYRTRNNNSTIFLRDFVNDCHLETTCTYDKNQLILPQGSNGFPLNIDHHGPLTISFDFQILTQPSSTDILLLTFDTPETFSVQIPSSKINLETRTAIIYHPDDRQMKIYINNECRTLEIPIITKFNIHILPTIACGIKNLGIWKYALSEEYIRRLFIFGLTYVAMDYHRLNKYRKQANTLTFDSKQQYFVNELLVPFNAPFDENIWEKKKQDADSDEYKYFKTINDTNQATIQLFGNETYLVLDKSIEPWSEYTLIIDILIARFPEQNERLVLITLNLQSMIYVTHDGQLCLSINPEINILSESKLKLNEYIRLLISVQEKQIQIYANGLLQLNATVDGDQLTIKDKRINLFREQDLKSNTIDKDAVRIECKSITYLNKATTIIDEKLKSSNYSLETMVLPPYSIMAPSLIRIGYDESRIKSILNENPTSNIQLIDTILRENSLSKFGPSIDKEKLKVFLPFSKIDADEKIVTLAEVILTHWDDIQISTDINEIPSDKNWFYQTVHHLNIDSNLSEWIRDKSVSIEENDLTHQLIDLNTSVLEQSTITNDIENQKKKILKSIQYSHQQIPHQQYNNSRISCEHGLISIYAHYTILNMLRVWSDNGSSVFPLEKFGDYKFIVTLLRLLDYHYVYTRMHTDEDIDRMSSLVSSIIQVETNELLKHYTITHDNKITREIFQHKAPLLHQLQTDIIAQLIQFVSNPSLLSHDYDDQPTIIDKQSMIKQPNFNFILKLVNLFVKFITDQSITKQHQVDFLISLLFPTCLVNLIFDLFLIIPMHQSKIIILQLFSNLIQASKNFNLSQHIQYFLFHLFIDFPPNLTSMNTRTMKTFQTTVMDLVYLLVERQKYQQIALNTTNQLVNFDFSKFSQYFHELSMTIEVINVLTDKTKHISFPEIFALQSIILLGDNIQFTTDDIQKSNTYFDTNSDLQLLNFMNNHPLVNLSFTEFINSLPNESVPNLTYYKAYPFLWHIPANCIQTRVKLFYQVSLLLEKLVSIVDLSQLSGQSILVDKIRTGKMYMLYKMKSQLFNTSLEMTQLSSDGDIPTVNFDTVKASINNNQDVHTMFNQAYEQLHDKSHLLFRRMTGQLWRAQYLAMHSTDQGGPYRDSISWICSDICSTRLPLFILCPNGRTNSGSNRDRWIPNVFPPNKPIPNRVKKHYRFIGQLMGMAIRHKHYLDLKLPVLLWKQLVREQITIEDIEAIDAQSFTMINEMEKNIEQNNQLIDTDSDINDLLSSLFDELRFEGVSSAGQTYELVPDGGKIQITASNFHKYCSSYRDYRLNEFRRQIEFIRQGLYSVIPGYFLNLFTSDELEEAVCGKGTMDIELLKRNTDYGGVYDQNSPAVLRFWTVIGEMFTEEQKKMFLKFVWGRCTLPKCDEDFTSKFRIDSYDVPNGSVDGALPRAHTCSFVLDLPAYSSNDIMYDRLNYAITYCSSIDGDGNMNDAPISTEFESE